SKYNRNFGASNQCTTEPIASPRARHLEGPACQHLRPRHGPSCTPRGPITNLNMAMTPWRQSTITIWNSMQISLQHTSSDVAKAIKSLTNRFVPQQQD